MILITITEKGLEVLDEAQHQGQNMRNEVYSVLNTEEVKQLLNIQRKLYERVKQLNKDDK